MKSTIEPFKLYHLSEQNHDGEIFEPRPMDRDRVMEGENWKLPRICVAKTIGGALSAISDCMQQPIGMKFWVHVPTNLEALFKLRKVHKPTLKQVPDSFVTGEYWLKAPAKMECIGQIIIDDIDDSADDIYYMIDDTRERLDIYKWSWTIQHVK